MSTTLELIETDTGWMYVGRKGGGFRLLIDNTNGDSANLQFEDAATLKKVGAALVEFAEGSEPPIMGDIDYKAEYLRLVRLFHLDRDKLRIAVDPTISPGLPVVIWPWMETLTLDELDQEAANMARLHSHLLTKDA